MKTKNLTIYALLLSVLFFGCVKHEVIPAPVAKVELTPHFNGIINGTDVEFTDDVDGYNGENTQAQFILTSPNLSKVVYYFAMNSNLLNTSIKVGVGSLSWDAGALDKPSLTQFNTFFSNLLFPAVTTYNNYPLDGFEVEYKDAFGNIWNSDPLSVNPQSVSFSAIANESDNTGDYSKFTVDFSCYVYRDIIVLGLPERDSIRIDNGLLNGWFLR